MKKLLLLFSIVSAFNLTAQIKVGNTTLDTISIASGLSTPWEIVWAEDSTIWFTERIGKVSRVNPETFEKVVLLDYTQQVEEFGEAGMLGMELLFSTAIPRVFLVFTYRADNNELYEKLVRFYYDPTKDTLFHEMIIQDSIPAAVNHDGSRIKIIDDYIFMSTGDAQNQSSAQNIHSLSGKILRYNLDGSIPSDNPISNSPVYSWGHRNPQGLLYANDILYSTEHGPTTDDEVNIIEKAKNYGWPQVHGLCNTASDILCNDSNVVEPIYSWTPTVATSDLIYYDHPAIPEFSSSLLMTSLKNERLYQLTLSSTADSIIGEKEFFTNYWGRIRDICSNDQGEIFIASNSGNHRIIKLYNPNYTGIPQINEQEFIRILPNPGNSEVKIELGNAYSDASLSVYSLSGKLIQSQKIDSKIITLHGLEFSSGMYLLEIKTKSKTIVRKIVIQ